MYVLACVCTQPKGFVMFHLLTSFLLTHKAEQAPTRELLGQRCSVTAFGEVPSLPAEQTSP